MSKYRAYTYDKTDGMVYNYCDDAVKRANQLEEIYGGCWMVEEIKEPKTQNTNDNTSSSGGSFIETIFTWVIIILALLIIKK